MTNEYTYSIIIPHKNCPDLLKRCVNSIPNRDDIQVIIIDDSSDEDKKPVQMRKGVEIVFLEYSKGAGRARNVGLEHAKGKWLLFADADDYFTENLSKILDKYANDTATDIVYLNANVFDEKGNIWAYKTSKLIDNFLSNIRGAEMQLKYSIWTPWSRMVKRQIVEDHQLKFDELPAGNDKMFCLNCSYWARAFKVESDVLYMYYKPNKGSQTDKMRSYMMLDDLLDLRVRTIALYNKTGYKPLPSVYEVVHHSKYSNGLSAKEVKIKYREYLKKANVSMMQDMYRYYKKKLNQLQVGITLKIKTTRCHNITR